MPVGRKYLEELLNRPPANTGSEVKRKAGDMLNSIIDKLRTFDDSYTARINRMYEGANPAVQAAVVVAGGGHPTLRKGSIDGLEGAAQTAMEYALPVASAVPKYVIPAAGVALAGRGVMDIAAGFGGPADEQEPGQLPITPGAVGLAALTGAAFAIPSVRRNMDESNIPVNRITEVNTRPFRM